MTFAKPKAKEKEENEYSTYCSIDGCGRKWAVRVDGEKPKCSYHQWVNSGKPKNPEFKPKKKETVKTVGQWYQDKNDDEVEF